MISCSLTAIAQQLLRFREANCRVYGSLVAVILLEHSCFAIRCGECSFDLLLQYAARSAAARLAIIGESLDRIVAMSYRARCLLTGPLVVTHNAFQSKRPWRQAPGLKLFFIFGRGGVACVVPFPGDWAPPPGERGRSRFAIGAFHRDCACGASFSCES